MLHVMAFVGNLLYALHMVSAIITCMANTRPSLRWKAFVHRGAAANEW